MAARLITLLLVLFLLGRVWLRYTRREISLRRMLFWVAPWLGLGVVMLSPGLADKVASLLGLETATGIDLMAYVAVGVSYYLFFRVFLHLDRIDQNLTTLTRHLALRDASDDRTDPHSDG